MVFFHSEAKHRRRTIAIFIKPPPIFNRLRPDRYPNSFPAPAQSDGLTRTAWDFELSDGEAMIDATVAGMGLCQMPLALFRQHIEAQRLVTV